jgi:hypothetical protein
VAHRRLAASVTVATLIILASGCSGSSSATPTNGHLRPKPATTVPTTVPAPTTTAPPSVTPTTAPVPVTQPPGWAGDLTSLPPGGGFTSLSCISDTFCVAAGGGTSGDNAELTTGSGVAASWDGASWSDPSVYYPGPPNGPVNAPVLPTITCTSGPTCVIVDGSDHVSDGNGTTWSTPAPLAGAPALAAGPTDPGPGHLGSRTGAVSCPSPTTCAIVDNTGHVYTLRDGRWLAPQSFGAPGSTVSLYQVGRVGVSCPSASQCTAVIGTSVLDWDGNTWSEEPAGWTSALASGPSQPTAIACPTTSWCAVVNGTGVSIRTAADRWSATQTIDPRGGLDSISCPTTSSCLAADGGGAVVSWNGAGWSAPDQVIPAATEYSGIGTTVSCPTIQFCMVMNSDGDYATYNGPGPGPG